MTYQTSKKLLPLKNLPILVLYAIFVIFLAFLNLGQFAQVSGFSSVNIYIFDIFCIFFVCYSLVYIVLFPSGKTSCFGAEMRACFHPEKRRDRVLQGAESSFFKNNLYFPTSFNFFILFSIFALFTLLIASTGLKFNETIISFFYFARWLFYLIASFLLYFFVNSNILSLKKVLVIFTIFGVLFVIAGYLQLIFLPDFTTLDISLGWDPHKNRLASTFFDPNFAGAYINICLFILLILWQKFIDKDKIYNKLLVIGTMFIFLSGLILTFSRSSWLMFALMVLIYGIIKNRKLVIFGFLIVFLAYFSVPRIQTRISGITDPADSAHFRLISWSNSLEIASDNLILGVGFNSFRYAQQQYGFIEPGEQGGHSGAGSDSSFMLVLATTGLFGLLLFSIGYFSSIFLKTGDKLVLSPLMLSLLLSLFVHSQFVNSIFYPQILFLWLFLSFAKDLYSDY